MSEKTHICRCGTAFVFRRHETSAKSSPIETDPSLDGNVAVLDDGRYRIIKKAEAYDGERFRSHFANCPFASGFRGKA